ncbi:MAG: ABC transporter substrate-binding protein [Goleter apudmare HA4340-LM2]|jgi:iron complex transport system substrate-binding protein|nr:ABC transporter substrate-binding protein [Goleter apudmare HA4340-LM2]
MSAIANAIYRLKKPFLLMALSLILITACYQPVIQKSNISTENSEGYTKCRIVQHKLGESCIPTHPKRIVILDEYYLLDIVSALDIKPVGFARCFLCIPSDTLSKFVADIPDVGDIGTPSLEKILILKPDLILGLEWQAKFYPLLSKIAPTVMIENPETNGFKKTLKYLAKILDKSDRVEEILAEYNQRIQNFRQQLGEKLKTKTVSILSASVSSFYIERPGFTIYSQVVSDVGIQFIPAYKDLKNNRTLLNIEILPDWDADFLFVLQNSKRQSKYLQFIFKQPIWSTLKSVQNNQVHIITLDVWGPITATRFIDDLYRYFINTPSIRTLKTKSVA